jgi:hypothetical protein
MDIRDNRLHSFVKPHAMEGYGASAPAKDLAKNFGFTPEVVVEKRRDCWGSKQAGRKSQEPKAEIERTGGF